MPPLDVRSPWTKTFSHIAHLFDWTSSNFFIKQYSNGDYAFVAFQEGLALQYLLVMVWRQASGYFDFKYKSPGFLLSHYGKPIHLEHTFNWTLMT